MTTNSINLQVNNKLLPFLNKRKRIKIAVGGRGSGKSVGLCDLLLMKVSTGRRVCCAREFQNSIDDSVHSTLKLAIDRLKIDSFKVLNNSISSSEGGSVFYKGLARNIHSVKSMGSVDILFIEEGESISNESLKVLTPSIRSGPSGADDDDSIPEIWIAMNRGSREGAIANKYLKRADSELKRCGYYEDELMIAIELNYTDNPWFPSELELERLDDKENLPSSEYDHIWGGEYFDDIENSIIKTEWFNAAIDAHIKLNFDNVGKRIVSHDPSDTGKDGKAVVLRHGSIVYDAQEMLTGDVNAGADWATGFAIKNNADVFTWDCDGLGISLRRQVYTSFDNTDTDIELFKGSESPDDKNDIYLNAGTTMEKRKAKTNGQTFKNKRAQYYWRLRDRFYQTYLAVEKKRYIDPELLISISSDIECINKLRSEVCSIPLKNNGNGQIQIMSKLEMERVYKLPSPNLADALMMSMINPKALNKSIDSMEFSSEW